MGSTEAVGVEFTEAIVVVSSPQDIYKNKNNASGESEDEQFSPVPPIAFSTLADEGYLPLRTCWGNYRGVIILLHWSYGFLGITRWRLNRLLGARDESAIYKWLSGRQRPSPVFLSRLVWMIRCKVEYETPWILVGRIDWLSGRLAMRDGSTLEPPPYKPKGTEE